MGDKQRGDIQIVMQPDQPIPQFLPDLRVDRPERLVEQEHARFGRQGPGDGHTLALSAGELMWEPPFQSLQAEEMEQLGDARLDVGSASIS